MTRRSIVLFAVLAGAAVLIVMFGPGGGEKLSADEYVSTGQQICADMGEQMSEVRDSIDGDADEEAQLEANQRATEISSSALSQLLDLSTPDELAAERADIIEQRDAFFELSAQYANGEVDDDTLFAQARRAEAAIDNLWPGCSNDLNG